MLFFVCLPFFNFIAGIYLLYSCKFLKIEKIYLEIVAGMTKWLDYSIDPFHNDVECVWKWGKRYDSLMNQNFS